MTTNSVSDIKFAERLPANLITNALSLIVSILVGLLITPFFIKTLGSAAYGLIPLATSISSYVILLTDSLNAATGRYLMFDLRSGNLDKARITYNTAFKTVIYCVLVLLPIAILLAYLSPAIFNIGNIAASDVSILFGLVFVSALLNILKSNFILLLTAYNLMYLKNIIAIIQTVLQVGLILLLFFFSGVSLIWVGFSYLLASIFSFILAFVFAKLFCPDFKIHPRKYASKSCFSELMKMTLWTLVKFTGALLRSNIGLVLANIICGVIAGAEYAIIFILQTTLIAIIGSVTSTYYPNVFVYCAQDDNKNLQKFLSLAIKTTVVFTGLVIGCIVIYSSEFLTIWVGAESAHLGLLAILLLFPVLFKGASDNANYVMVAKLKNRQNALIYLIAGVLTTICSAIGAYFFGLTGLVVAGGIIMILVECGCMFIYTERLMNLKKGMLMKTVLPGIFMLMITVAIGFLIKLFLTGESIISLIAGTLVIIVISFTLSSRILFSKEERTNIRLCIPAWLNKILPKRLF